MVLEPIMPLRLPCIMRLARYLCQKLPTDSSEEANFFWGTPSDNYRQVASMVPVVSPEVFRFNRRTRRLDAGP